MQAFHGSWGNRHITFSWDGGISTILFLEPHQRCSLHLHRTAWNQFFVIQGKLGVKTDKGYTTELGPRQVFTVEPGVEHEFLTYDEPTIVEEVAYVRYNPADIDRKRLGGPVNG